MDFHFFQDSALQAAVNPYLCNCIPQQFYPGNSDSATSFAFIVGLCAVCREIFRKTVGFLFVGTGFPTTGPCVAGQFHFYIIKSFLCVIMIKLNACRLGNPRGDIAEYTKKKYLHKIDHPKQGQSSQICNAHTFRGVLLFAFTFNKGFSKCIKEKYVHE